MRACARALCRHALLGRCARAVVERRAVPGRAAQRAGKLCLRAGGGERVSRGMHARATLCSFALPQPHLVAAQYPMVPARPSPLATGAEPHSVVVAVGVGPSGVCHGGSRARSVVAPPDYPSAQASVSFAAQLAGTVSVLIAGDASPRSAADIAAGGPCSASMGVNASAWTVLFVPCPLSARTSWLFAVATDASGTGELAPPVRVTLPSVHASVMALAPYAQGTFALGAQFAIQALASAGKQRGVQLPDMQLQDASGCPVAAALTLLVGGSSAAAAVALALAGRCDTAACWNGLPGVACAFAPPASESCPVGLRNASVAAVGNSTAPPGVDLCTLSAPLASATPYVIVSLASTPSDGAMLLGWASVTTPSTALAALGSSVAILPHFAPAVSAYYGASLASSGACSLLPCISLSLTGAAAVCRRDCRGAELGRRPLRHAARLGQRPPRSCWRRAGVPAVCPAGRWRLSAAAGGLGAAAGPPHGHPQLLRCPRAHARHGHAGRLGHVHARLPLHARAGRRAGGRSRRGAAGRAGRCGAVGAQPGGHSGPGARRARCQAERDAVPAAAAHRPAPRSPSPGSARCCRRCWCRTTARCATAASTPPSC
jgi:hypothetical protein